MREKIQRGRTIDVHAHMLALGGPETEGKLRDIMPRLSYDEAGREIIMVSGKSSYLLPEYLYKPELRIQEMDKNRVDIQVLSMMAPLARYDLDPELGVGYSRIQNEAIAKVVRAHPDRFVGLATVPLQDPGQAANELERAMRELGMKGVEIATDVNGKNLDWAELWPFYARAEKLGAFVLVHPGVPPGAAQMRDYALFNLIGYPFVTSLAGASLIFSGVLEDFPRLKFCFAHGGGFLPYQRGRLEHGYRVKPECRRKIPRPPSDYFRLLYFDTVTHDLPALEYLIRTAGVDKVLMGSDYPFDVNDPDPVDTVFRLESISIEGKRKLWGENAAGLLGITGMQDQI
jgi:aminocarboxymuconate-semialdehyde decarboxylase